MKHHRPTAQRKRRHAPDEAHAPAEAHEAAPSPSVALLRDAGAPQALRAESIAGAQRAAGNAAVERALVQRERPGAEIQRQGKNVLDATARALIAAAQDQSRSIEERAVELVRGIIQTYYSSAAPKVAGIRYEASVPGLETEPVGSGAQARGRIFVSEYFMRQTTAQFFARRVLQVGHELVHIDQYRAGMGGDKKKYEREFLAHFWTATAQERPGTGRVSHSTRIDIIDEALRNLYALSPAARARYADKERTLLELRTEHQQASGGPPTPAPAPAP